MGFRYVGMMTVPLTPELAEEFATMPTVVERRFKPEREAFLSRRIERGEFYSPKWATVTLDGQTYRVNGQHSSLALTKANGHFPKHLNAVIERFACDTKSDAVDLFEQFDNPMSSRTGREHYGVVQQSVEWAAEYRSQYLQTAISAALVADNPKALRGASLIHRNGGVKLNFSKEFRPALQAHRDWITWYMSKNWKGDKSVRLRCISAAICQTWRIDADDADAFWGLALNGTHPDALNASRTLHTFLIQIESKGSPQRAQYGERGMYVKCIQAWNAWRRNMTTTLRVVGDVIPDAI